MKISRRTIFTFISWLVGGVLLWLLFERIGTAELLAAARSIPRWQLAAVSMFPLVTFGIAAARWKIVLRAIVRDDPPFRTLLAYMFAGALASMAVPSISVSGSALQAFLVARRGIPGVKAAASVALEFFGRFVPNTALTLFFMSGALMVGAVSFGGSPRGSMVIFGFAPLLLGVFFLYRALRHGGILTRIARHIIHTDGVMGATASFEAELEEYFRTRTDVFWKTVGISIIGYAWEIIQSWLFLRFVGLELTLWHVVVWHSVVVFAKMFPSPAGLGFVETSSMLIAGLLSQPSPSGLGFVILWRIRDLVTASFGGAVMLAVGLRRIVWRGRMA